MMKRAFLLGVCAATMLLATLATRPNVRRKPPTSDVLQLVIERTLNTLTTVSVVTVIAPRSKSGFGA